MAEQLLGARKGRHSSSVARTIDLRQNLFRIPDNISISLGLRWDFIGAEPVDLDASCVAFDDEGNVVDVVFFNHLKVNAPCYMEHSGDNQTGENIDGAEEKDDEIIYLHMNLIPSNIFYMMVCVTSYTGADFTLVEKASCRLVNLTTGESVGEFQLGIVGRHTATLLCSFSRVATDPQGTSMNPAVNPMAAQANKEGGGANNALPNWWDLREINFPCTGYTFCDVLPKMLDFLAVPEDQRELRLSSLPDYPLTKEDETNTTLSQIKMGLGWDGENDLDAALILLNDKCQYVDHVYAKSGRLKSRDGAAIHSGDKLNGYDVAGDDEFIDIDLNKVDKEVTFLFFIGLLYDGLAKSMGAVPHGYLRIVNRASPLEKNTKDIQRFSLTKQGGDSTAIVFSYCRRMDAAHWKLFICDAGAQGRDYVDVFPLVRSIAMFHEKPEQWQDYRLTAEKRFGVELTVLEARDLGPLEPHQFACHVRAWVHDRKGKGRGRTKTVRDRNRVSWGTEGEGEAFCFEVNRMDVIRILLYEYALCGLVDLAVGDVVDAIEGNPQSPLSNKAKKKIRRTTFVTPEGSPATKTEVVPLMQGNGNGNGTHRSSNEGETEMITVPVAEANSSHNNKPSALDATELKDHSNRVVPHPTFEIVTDAEGESCMEDWFALQGRGITGELKLRLRVIPLSEIYQEGAEKKSKRGGWCSMM